MPLPIISGKALASTANHSASGSHGLSSTHASVGHDILAMNRCTRYNYFKHYLVSLLEQYAITTATTCKGQLMGYPTWCRHWYSWHDIIHFLRGQTHLLFVRLGYIWLISRRIFLMAWAIVSRLHGLCFLFRQFTSSVFIESISHYYR